MTRERYNELVDLLSKANYEYHVLDNATTLSDQEYDNYLREVYDIENEHPDWKRADSPTVKVGGQILEKFEKVTHNIPMMSLADVFNYDEIKQFDTKIKNEGIDPKYVCELKIDGLSVSLKYKNGVLISAATRGDGVVGEDITHNVKTIKQVPLRINKPIDIEVRGEIYLSKKSLEQINKERIKNGEPVLKNCRNAAAGSIRQLDSSVAAKRNLEVWIYHLPNPEDYGIKTHHEALRYMESLGFRVNPNNRLVANIEEVMNYIDEKNEARPKLPYDIDGVVIKLDDISAHAKLGNTIRYPKWAVAYKFPAEKVETKLLDIIFTVGRTGQITPNAVLEPVMVMGSLISRATLHNQDYCIEKDIRIGDTVKIIKAGDVIPRVDEVVKANRKGNEQPFKMIEFCPMCNTKLIMSKSEVDYFCPNDSCPARKIESLIHFVDRKAMNIIGLGENIIEDFFNEGIITDFLSIYKLKEHAEELVKMEGFGEKSITKLLDNIEASKNNDFDRIIYAIGIKGIGEKNAKILAKKYKNIDNLIKATYEELNQIDDIGPILAQNIIEFFSEQNNITMVNNLKNIGINMQYSGDLELYDERITDKRFVITGSLEAYSRDEIKDIISNYGGKTSDSVSKKTDVVIVGEDPGSKYDKAKSLNIEIWNQDKLKEMEEIFTKYNKTN